MIRGTGSPVFATPVSLHQLYDSPNDQAKSGNADEHRNANLSTIGDLADAAPVSQFRHERHVCSNPTTEKPPKLRQGGMNIVHSLASFRFQRIGSA